MIPSIHQINTVTGDIAGNFEKIKKGILEDSKNGPFLSIFPETAITGYMCGSLWDREDFIKDQLEKVYEIRAYLEELEYEGTVILGFIDFLGMKKNGFPRLKNAAAIIDKEKIRIYDKQLLASADHHEDKKYFEPGDRSLVFTCKVGNETKEVGVLICEDAWISDHNKNIPNEMFQMGAEILVHINQSYFYYGKQEKRIALGKHIAQNYKIPFVSVNAIGVGDILKNIVIFDGSSFIIDDEGNCAFVAPSFEEYNGKASLSDYNAYSPKSKYKEICDALLFEQKEFYRLCGIEKAQVHVSGGLDSAIVAALVKKAMGKENTVLITNPSNLNTESLKYVKALADGLEMEYYTFPVQEIFDTFVKVFEKSFQTELSKSGQSCAQATLRSVQGLVANHLFKSGIVATGNHTEIVLGWATFHDIGSIGTHALIGDLTKMELYELARYINKFLYQKEVIPEDLFNGKFVPAAELPDAKEDPIDYTVQSGICAMLIRERKNQKQILKEMYEQIPNPDYFPDLDEVRKYTKEELKEQIGWAVKAMKRSVFKAGQGAPTVIISPRSRGFSNRETLINYYNI
jgi:NAD+ synthase (glutamine-hydrolysing)